MIKNLIITALTAIAISNDFAFSASNSVENTHPIYRSDYHYVSTANTFFKVVNAKKSWYTAKTMCNAEGADLAVFRTKKEADAVLELITALSKNIQIVWVGLQDLISEGEFETTKGVPISDIFADWGENEPNNFGGQEHCVAFDSDGKYNDFNCSALYPYVCEKRADTITPNVACANFDLAYKLTSIPHQCIKFHKEPKTFGEANLICKAEQAHLAIINSQQEADLYSREWAKYPKDSLRGNFSKDDLLLGYHNVRNQNEFRTIFGDTLSEAGYDKWSPGQPDNNAGVEHCGGMFRDGTLNDLDCNIRALFICEKTSEALKDMLACEE